MSKKPSYRLISYLALALVLPLASNTQSQGLIKRMQQKRQEKRGSQGKPFKFFSQKAHNRQDTAAKVEISTPEEPKAKSLSPHRFYESCPILSRDRQFMSGTLSDEWGYHLTGADLARKYFDEKVENFDAPYVEHVDSNPRTYDGPSFHGTENAYIFRRYLMRSDERSFESSREENSFVNLHDDSARPNNDELFIKDFQHAMKELSTQRPDVISFSLYRLGAASYRGLDYDNSIVVSSSDNIHPDYDDEKKEHFRGVLAGGLSPLGVVPGFMSLVEEAQLVAPAELISVPESVTPSGIVGGTSVAAPMIAAGIANLRALLPQISQENAVELLRKSGRNYAIEGHDLSGLNMLKALRVAHRIQQSKGGLDTNNADIAASLAAPETFDFSASIKSVETMSTFFPGCGSSSAAPPKCEETKTRFQELRKAALLAPFPSKHSALLTCVLQRSGFLADSLHWKYFDRSSDHRDLALEIPNLIGFSPLKRPHAASLLRNFGRDSVEKAYFLLSEDERRNFLMQANDYLGAGGMIQWFLSPRILASGIDEFVLNQETEADLEFQWALAFAVPKYLKEDENGLLKRRVDLWRQSGIKDPDLKKFLRQAR